MWRSKTLELSFSNCGNRTLGGNFICREATVMEHNIVEENITILDLKSKHSDAY